MAIQTTTMIKRIVVKGFANKRDIGQLECMKIAENEWYTDIKRTKQIRNVTNKQTKKQREIWATDKNIVVGVRERAINISMFCSKRKPLTVFHLSFSFQCSYLFSNIIRISSRKQHSTLFTKNIKLQVQVLAKFKVCYTKQLVHLLCTTFGAFLRFSPRMKANKNY